MRRLYGVAYPDPLPDPAGPAPEADPGDERAMALRFVRTSFTPPLPDAFADWYTHLLTQVRDGKPASTPVVIPLDIRALGYTFARALGEGTHLRLDDALYAFGRVHLAGSIASPDPVESSTHGVISLAAALMARGIRTTTTLHRLSGGCTVQLTDDQAAQLADMIIPAEGSMEDELAQALELLDRLVEKPRPGPCSPDHHGYCQEHYDDMGGGRFAQQEGHALLVRHRVRQEGQQRAAHTDPT